MGSITAWLLISLAIVAGLSHLVMAWRNRHRAISLFFAVVGLNCLAVAFVFTLALIGAFQIPGQGNIYVRPLLILTMGLLVGYALLLWDNKT